MVCLILIRKDFSFAFMLVLLLLLIKAYLLMYYFILSLFSFSLKCVHTILMCQLLICFLCAFCIQPVCVYLFVLHALYAHHVLASTLFCVLTVSELGVHLHIWKQSFAGRGNRVVGLRDLTSSCLYEIVISLLPRTGIPALLWMLIN